MGYLRYWQPPTKNEQAGNAISLYSFLASFCFFLAVTTGFLVMYIIWLIFFATVVYALVKIFKSDFSRKELKIGVDISILAIISLLINGAIHLFILAVLIFR